MNTVTDGPCWPRHHCLRRRHAAFLQILRCTQCNCPLSCFGIHFMLLCHSPRERQSRGADYKDLSICSEGYAHSPGVSRSPSPFSYAETRPDPSGGPPSPRVPWQEESDPPATYSGNPRTHEATLGLVRRRELAAIYWAKAAICYFGFFRLGELILPTDAPITGLC